MQLAACSRVKSAALRWGRGRAQGRTWEAIYILFNHEMCYVVAPGVVKKIMETISAIAEYEREGNLYIGEMTVQSSHRQGPTK